MEIRRYNRFENAGAGPDDPNLRTAEQLPQDEAARERLDALREVTDRVAHATAEVIETWAAERRALVTTGAGVAGP